MARTSLLPRLLVLSALLVACGPSTCCRSAEVEQYNVAHHNSLMRGTSRFEYTRPLEQVWPEILGVTAEHGYRIEAPSPVEGRTLESAAKTEPEGTSRLLLRIVRIDPARWKISVEKQLRSPEDGGERITIETNGYEAGQIAWTILQRVEPTKASELLAEADATAERASVSGRGYDRGCGACARLVTPPPQ